MPEFNVAEWEKDEESGEGVRTFLPFTTIEEEVVPENGDFLVIERGISRKTYRVDFKYHFPHDDMRIQLCVTEVSSFETL